MSRKSFLLLLVLLLSACGPRPTASQPTPGPDQVNTEEQAVYAALLKQTYSAGMIVIMETTSTDPGSADPSTSRLDYVMENLHDVDKSVATDFQARNDKAYPLSLNMKLGVTYVLLTQEQRNGMFGQNQSGWEVFYQNYPGTPGITTLSRVGFNPSFDQALVYIGTESNWLAGAGYYILLKKVSGTWEIDQKVMTWIS